MNFVLALLIILLLPVSALGQVKTLYVDGASIGGTCDDTAGNTRATNSITNPWCTIEVADGLVLAGDTVLVRAGTYSVDLSLNKDGTSWSAPITWESFPRRAATIVGQTATAAVNLYGDYLIFEGFNVTTDYIPACLGYGGRGIEFRVAHGKAIDNYVYDCPFTGIGSQAGARDDIEVRDNHIYKCSSGIYGNGTHWLIKDNDIERLYWWPDKCDVDSDYMHLYLGYSVIQGNYFHDTVQAEIDYTAYCTGAGTPYANCSGAGACAGGDCFAHVDGAVSFDTAVDGQKNLYANNVFMDFHQGIMTAYDAGNHHWIVRNNVFAHELGGISGIAVDIKGLNNIYVYNNTVYDLKTYGVWAQVSTATPNYIMVKNNIFDLMDAGYPYVLTGVNSLGDYNDVYACAHAASPAGANDIATDPLMVSPTTDSYGLQSASPAKNAGSWLTTITTATGSGTSFAVGDAGYFFDGETVITGDSIKLSNGQAGIITDITTNTITLDRSVSWTVGDGVALSYVGTAPDMGAYEYGAQTTVTFTAVDDASYEGGIGTYETILFAITDGVYYNLGSPSQQTLNIEDDDPPPAIPPTPGVLKGIYMLGQFDSLTTQPYSLQTFTDGYAARVTWRLLDSGTVANTPVYDWAYIDNLFTNAGSYGNKVTIYLSTSVTPDHVLIGADTYTPLIANTQYTTPVPWDPVALADLDSFADALAAHTVGGVAVKNRSELAGLRITPIGLKGLDDEGSPPRMVNDPAYTPGGAGRATFLAAVNTTLQSFVDAFPGIPIYIEIQAFYDDTTSPRLDTATIDSIEAAFDGVPNPVVGFFAEVWSSTTPITAGQQGINLMHARSHGSPVLFQATHTWVDGSVEEQGMAFSFGHNPNTYFAHYFEVYRTDITDTGLSTMFEQWQNVFSGTAVPGPCRIDAAGTGRMTFGAGGTGRIEIFYPTQE